MPGYCRFSRARFSRPLKRVYVVCKGMLFVLIARENLTGLAKARFESQLVKTNNALLQFAGQIAENDLLPTP
jgi:hypothetical protein